MNMKTPNGKVIRIQERDGSISPFSALELQTRLIGTFLASGRRENSYLAEDIALAVEYTLSRLPRPEPVFARGEIDAAVIRLLEETGFPDVARIFRKGGAVESTTRIAADPETLQKLLRRFFCASDDKRFAKLLAAVLEAADKLKLKDASPHLWLELARHYDALLEPETCEDGTGDTELVTLTRDELYELLPETAKRWTELGILRINGVTSLFPCVHFFFLMTDFAVSHGLSGIVTELELEPLLYQAGTVLEESRRAIENRLTAEPKTLPCLLTIPDMFDFITEYAGGERLGSESLAAELAGTLTSGLACDLYKLSLG